MKIIISKEMANYNKESITRFSIGVGEDINIKKFRAFKTNVLSVEETETEYVMTVNDQIFKDLTECIIDNMPIVLSACKTAALVLKTFSCGFRNVLKKYEDQFDKEYLEMNPDIKKEYEEQYPNASQTEKEKEEEEKEDKAEEKKPFGYDPQA